MTPALQKILKALAKELTLQVTIDVTAKLRESYMKDVTEIVKSCLRNDEVLQDSGLGYITMKVIAEKYNVSERTVSEKCRLFKIDRKKSGRNKLVNERQFFDAMQYPTYVPKFLHKVLIEKCKKVT
jgi:hypothetical protein